MQYHSILNSSYTTLTQIHTYIDSSTPFMEQLANYIKNMSTDGEVFDLNLIYYEHLFNELAVPKRFSLLHTAVKTTLAKPVHASSNQIQQFTDIFSSILRSLKKDTKIYSHLFKTTGLSFYIPEDEDGCATYAKILANIFSPLAESDTTCLYYLPYLVSCFLININPLNNDEHQEFFLSETSLETICENEFTKTLFTNLVQQCNFKGRPDFLQSYCKKCHDYYQANNSNERFFRFWAKFYLLFRVFSTCADNFSQHSYPNIKANSGASFILFLSQLYSSSKNISFEEFITLFTLYFSGAIANNRSIHTKMYYSSDEKNYNEICSCSIIFLSPEKIFSRFLNIKSPFADQSLYAGYIFFMLCNLENALPDLPVLPKFNTYSEYAMWNEDYLDSEKLSVIYDNITYSITPAIYSVLNFPLNDILREAKSDNKNAKTFNCSYEDIIEDYTSINFRFCNKPSSDNERIPALTNLYSFYIAQTIAEYFRPRSK